MKPKAANITLLGKFLLGLILAVINLTQAHTIERLIVNSKVEEGFFITKFELDAGYGIPELKADEYAQQPERAWLIRLPEAKQLLIRDQLLLFSKRYLKFTNRSSQATSQIQSEYHFPDWNKSPPVFPKAQDGKAYVSVTVKTPIPKEGNFTIEIDNSDDIPTTVIVFQKKEQSEPDIIDLNRGDSYPLLTIKRQESEDNGTLIIETKQSFWRAIWQGSKNGFIHVIPDGFDHALFILAICLITVSTKSILLQSLLFTCSHSITYIVLGMGWLSLHPTVLTYVEIAIGLSIIAMAIENLFRIKEHTNTRPSKTRLNLILLFGLIHGLGFASAMNDKIPAQGSNLLTYLVSANLGIEIAQLCIITLACLMLRKLKVKQRIHVNRLGSISIAAAAICLLIF